MTYYKIQKYLIEHGLSVGRADYVRNMCLLLIILKDSTCLAEL